ncbi:peptide/nickel transport system permease protein/oligopeptide transport system permease protein [Allocatelliglobosispora scoriae]|uniref:Peptide/nickel transport system permease protein/oligopeptide transport system permease protein n=1 Tax=Allocatelliglobosispora scoriae TaxID=643052 RepID=A0A841BXC2_9ACTN|nr:ABC transporter permease [Allocatelliglobosispora scoriae]MBB5871573.1 peptide/nickel transport system permease protein/oligopeptide transport system permease protein [Allocatelliglobosispora scoriae]
MSDFETVGATELHSATPGLAGEPGAPGQPTTPSEQAKVRSAAADAWRVLRRNPIFWIASLIAVVVIVMACWPSLFTSADPNACSLDKQMAAPSGSAIFGYNFQGCDVYAHAVYGARNSLLVGGGAAILAGIIAMVIGMLSGYFGGWADAIISRMVDIVLAIPLLLGAIVLMKRVPTGNQGLRVATLILILGLLGWTTAARVVRSSVITAKQQDYVSAARMLGAGNGRIMWRHMLPNVVAPFLVIITIALGAFIASEATLSFLGVGLKPPSISWGIDISDSRGHMREKVTPLAVPSMFLALTVLAFIMLGDAIRDAFDPKLR